MSEQTAAENLRLEWGHRSNVAAVDIDYAQQAPALFRDEWWARAEAEFRRALAFANYWQAVAS